MAQVEERMVQTEDKIRVFKSKHAEGMPEFVQENMRNLRNLEKEVSTLEALYQDTEIERMYLARRLAEEPEMIQVESEEVGGEVPARLAGLRIQIAEFKASGLQEEHPYLRQLLAEEALLNNKGQDATNTSTGSSTTLTETIPNEVYQRLKGRYDELTVISEQSQRQLRETKNAVAKAREIVERTPLLEQRYAELSRGQVADQETYEQISKVLEMAQLQLKLEMEAASSRLELFTPPRLRFSSALVLLIATTIAGMMAGVALVGGIWSLQSLRRLVWPEGMTSGRAR